MHCGEWHVHAERDVGVTLLRHGSEVWTVGGTYDGVTVLYDDATLAHCGKSLRIVLKHAMRVYAMRNMLYLHIRARTC